MTVDIPMLRALIDEATEEVTNEDGSRTIWRRQTPGWEFICAGRELLDELECAQQHVSALMAQLGTAHLEAHAWSKESERYATERDDAIRERDAARAELAELKQAICDHMNQDGTGFCLTCNSREETAQTLHGPMVAHRGAFLNRQMHRAVRAEKDRDAATVRAESAEGEARKLRTVLDQWREYRFQCSDTPGATARLTRLLHDAEDATAAILDGAKATDET